MHLTCLSYATLFWGSLGSGPELFSLLTTPVVSQVSLKKQEHLSIFDSNSVPQHARKDVFQRRRARLGPRAPPLGAIAHH